MGFDSTKERQQPRVTARRDVQQARFEEYFARVFAYGLGATGSEEAARRLTVAAFAEAFALPDMREPEFELEIFRAARSVARAMSGSKGQFKDGLTGRERDVLSLVFDGQLQRDQVGSLLSLRSETVLGILLKGLRKMRDPMPAAALPAIPEFYRA
jgi:DNA-binding CsgD family transcriptional regulator